MLAALVAFEWISAPGVDDLRPVNADSALIAARSQQSPGEPPPLHIPVAWKQMTSTMKNATVAIEDQRFYDHGAIDYRGLLRAAFRNVFSAGAHEGGSTIAQQLARTLYIPERDRNLGRKVRETKLAMQLEDRHSKKWILWQYLNSIPYGAVNGRIVIGVEAAAQAFFSTSASRLSLADAALLAGLPQSPTRYDPFKHPQAARARRSDVLQKMVELGYASRPAAERAELAPVALSTCGAPATQGTLHKVAFAEDRRSAATLDPELAPFMERAGPHSSAYVYDATTRKPLFRWRERVPQTLASNTKLFTAAAVLNRLPPLGSIRTRLLGEGSLRRGVWRGDIYLRGAGNPIFGSKESHVDVRRLARQLRQRGIKEVRGRVLGDGSLFDSRLGGPDSGGRTSIFIGPVAALSFNRGKSRDPEGAYQGDPILVAARVMRAAMQRRGIQVKGRAGTGAAPKGSSKLASVPSRRIEEIVRRMLKWSDSYGAEVLLKNIAARVSGKGTTAIGAREAVRFARSLGVEVSLRDGSGLCRKNKASAREVVRLLDRLRDRPNFPAFSQALPVAGRDGTLFNRMRSTPARDRCRAKTATLSNVSNLSGYCRTRRGHTIVFSFMMDGIDDVQAARQLQDRMVTSIACRGSTASARGARAASPQPLFGGGGKQRVVALTFDDGPSRFTRTIVNLLRRKDAGATFFQTGHALKRGQPIRASDRRRGISIGTHTYTHSDLGRLTFNQQLAEIMTGVRALTRHGSPFPRLFRPPYDSYNAATLEILRRLRMRMVLQTVDTQDWLRKRREIVRRALDGVQPGGIVLMHDGGGNRRETIAALPEIIDGLHQMGYRVVDVPTLLREDPPPLDRPVSYRACPDTPALAAGTPEMAAKEKLESPWSWRALLRVGSR